MFQNLVNHNDDMWRLVEKGYAVAFDSNCLVVRDIPYLDSDRKLQVGAIVTKSVRRIKIAMASGCPSAQVWGLAAERLAAANARGSPA